MQEKAGEQGAAYIPMPKGRGFTPHFDKELLGILLVDLLREYKHVILSLSTQLFQQVFHLLVFFCSAVGVDITKNSSLHYTISDNQLLQQWLFPYQSISALFLFE